MLTNRPEFHLVDTAALHAGATPFSIYNTLAPEQIAHLFGNAGNRVVVCEEQFLDPIRKAAPRRPRPPSSTSCASTATPRARSALADLETARGRRLRLRRVVARGRAARRADDHLHLGHHRAAQGRRAHARRHARRDRGDDRRSRPISADDSVISYLPDAHIANRWGAHYTSIASGMHIVTLADMKQMISVLPAVRPTFFGAVPQVWYKLKAGHRGPAGGREVAGEEAARGAGRSTSGRRRARLLSDGRRCRRRCARSTRWPRGSSSAKVRARLGLDRVKFAATGAAAIDPQALEFVLALGLPCCEIWGMSEITCAATVNPPDAIRIGTVGQAIARGRAAHRRRRRAARARTAGDEGLPQRPGEDGRGHRRRRLAAHRRHRHHRRRRLRRASSTARRN